MPDQPTRDSEDYEATSDIGGATFLDIWSHNLRSGTRSILSAVWNQDSQTLLSILLPYRSEVLVRM